MIDQRNQQEIVQAASSAFGHMSYVFQASMSDLICPLTMPSVLYRPKLSIDGDEWCALYGENLQDGVAGFGKSPELAMADFDRSWVKSLEAKS